MFAHACAYEKFFVPLCAFYGFMDELIRHTGIVLSINGEMAHVQIVQTSACSACKARSMCMSSESQNKEMDAIMLEPMKIGDKVEVEVRERLAWKAVLLAYILPFIVMLAIIAIPGFYYRLVRSRRRNTLPLRHRAVLHRPQCLQAPLAEAVHFHGKKI